MDAPAITRRSPFRIWHAAAAALVLGTGGWWLLRPPAVANQMVEVRVPAGDSTRSVQLPDGSRAWMAAGSTIRYREGFDGGERSVELPDGQVMFAVGQQTEHPFIVKTGKGVEVKVLGTEFTITSWPEIPQTEVFVTSGAVQVSDSTGRQEVLRARESLEHIPGTAMIKRTGDRPDLRSGKWMLKDAGFPTIAAFVKRRYGMVLNFDASLLDRRFTVFTETNTTSNTFFDTITLLSGIPYRVTGNTVTFFASQP